MIVILLSAMVGAALGVALGFLLRASLRRSPANHDQVHRNAVHFMREGDELRRTVMDFVRRARLERPPGAEDWRALVEAVMHRGTPDPIRELHHKQCGTAWPQVTETSQSATPEDGGAD